MSAKQARKAKRTPRAHRMAWWHDIRRACNRNFWRDAFWWSNRPMHGKRGFW